MRTLVPITKPEELTTRRPRGSRSDQFVFTHWCGLLPGIETINALQDPSLPPSRTFSRQIAHSHEHSSWNPHRQSATRRLRPPVRHKPGREPDRSAEIVFSSACSGSFLSSHSQTTCLLQPIPSSDSADRRSLASLSRNFCAQNAWFDFGRAGQQDGQRCQ